MYNVLAMTKDGMWHLWGQDHAGNRAWFSTKHNQPIEMTQDEAISFVKHILENVSWVWGVKMLETETLNANY